MMRNVKVLVRGPQHVIHDYGLLSTTNQKSHCTTTIYARCPSLLLQYDI